MTRGRRQLFLMHLYGAKIKLRSAYSLFFFYYFTAFQRSKERGDWTAYTRGTGLSGDAGEKSFDVSEEINHSYI